MIKAWEEYSPIEEKIFLPDGNHPAWGQGNQDFWYTLIEDNLTIINDKEYFEIMSPLGQLITLSQIGDFVRVE